jgi:hypothetical protein
MHSRCLAFFFLWSFGGSGEGLFFVFPLFTMCSHKQCSLEVSNWFPSGSQYVPQHVFSIAPHFYPICFGKCCALLSYTSMLLVQQLPHSQLIFPSKMWFFEIYLNFQQQKSLKNQYLPHSKSKSCRINSMKSCSSRSFQQHQRARSNSSKIFSYDLIEFSVMKSFNTQRTFAPQVQTPWNQAYAPLLVESFQTKDVKNTIWSIQFGRSHKLQNKTNYLSFIDKIARPKREEH